MKMHATRGVVGFLAAVIALGGCDGIDPHSEAASQARQREVPALMSAVDEVLDGLPTFGAGRSDTCEAGQNNFSVRDPYRMRCGAHYRVVAGLDAEDRDAAIAETQTHLTRAGCRGSGSTNPLDFNVLRPGPTTAVWGGGYICRGVNLSVVIGRADDQSFADEVGNQLPGPCCTTIQEEQLDAAEAFDQARKAGHTWVLIGDAGRDYYVEPRD